jgi:hypothetical protein
VTPEARLADLLADLVSESRHEPVLLRLFRRDAGEWLPLRDALADQPDLLRLLHAIADGADTEPLLAWLADPFAGRREGYCLVAVYWEEVVRCPVALYNRERLMSRVAPRADDMPPPPRQP